MKADARAIDWARGLGAVNDIWHFVVDSGLLHGIEDAGSTLANTLQHRIVLQHSLCPDAVWEAGPRLPQRGAISATTVRSQPNERFIRRRKELLANPYRRRVHLV